ncbi:MAG: hypothetical protein J0H54_02530 [Rhizobiales bacterium]|nr:hypothetical protein [Hyphomicrobiales bacterium]
MLPSFARARLRGLGAVAVLAVLVAGCNSMVDGSSGPTAGTAPAAGTGSGGNVVTNALFGTANPAQQNAIVVSSENFGFDVNDCPNVSIRPGTEAMTTFKPGEKINPELGEKPTIQYQASIVTTARECMKADGGVRVKVGIKGRVVGGAGAKAGALNMPIRVVVMQGTDTVVTSTLYKVPVTLAEPDYSANFTKIDDSIVLPIAPGNTDYRIYVGFDEGSSKKKNG